MQIVAVTDPLQVGFPRQAMIGIRVEGDIAVVADKLAAMPEVDYVVITAGQLRPPRRVVCEDDDHLLESQPSASGPSRASSTETFVYLKLRKQIYTWGMTDDET
jgi:Lrp/AsnC family transcriptional regulator for asnA, asnC and gidA